MFAKPACAGRTAGLAGVFVCFVASSWGPSCDAHGAGSEPQAGDLGRGATQLHGVGDGATEVQGRDARRVERLELEPARVVLRGPENVQSLLVTGTLPGGRAIDLAREAIYASSDESVARVSAQGVVRPVADGVASVTVVAGGVSVNVPVAVEACQAPGALNFENDIVPILSRLGCNSGACHGKADGQNGFKLSVFGFDPRADYDAIVTQSRGRRIVPGAPEYSLIVRKPSGLVPHGGGERIGTGSRDYRTLVRWLAAGTPYGAQDDPRVELIDVLPRERTLGLDQAQQFQVTAVFSDGSRRDVTERSHFRSHNPAVAEVNDLGLVQAGGVPGEAGVMVNYLEKVAVARVMVPQELSRPFDRPLEHNWIDALVWDKLEQLGLQPSTPCSDADFLRRAHLDVIGTLPTPAEARAFLSDARDNKRAALVESLLQRPEYVDFWALRWADLLRIDRLALQAKGAYTFYEWLRAGLRENKPYDQFVREIVTAQGPSDRVGPVNLYRALATPEQTASTISQVFLGVRIQCAQCHHHPSDRWSQSDFYGMVGFFNRLQRRAAGQGESLSIGPPAEVKHPRTGQSVPPHPLAGAPAEESSDLRTALADWITSPDNRYFARAIANRLWGHFLGRGLVEPIDDMSEANPASNEPLLGALARYFVEQEFDVKQLIRTITGSQVYQLSSISSATSANDDRYYSHAAFKPIQSEVLLDAISQATGRPETFPLLPDGTRAIQLWDNRMEHYFLKLFGRPLRQTSCQCERVDEPSVAQVLHLMNAPEIHARITHPRGRAAELAGAGHPPETIIEELYLATYSRLPSADECRTAAAYFQSVPAAQRTQAAEDLLWTLLNTTEFLFNH